MGMMNMASKDSDNAVYERENFEPHNWLGTQREDRVKKDWMTARCVSEDLTILINESKVAVVLDEILRNGYDENMLDVFHSPASKHLRNLLPIERMYLY